MSYLKIRKITMYPFYFDYHYNRHHHQTSHFFSNSQILVRSHKSFHMIIVQTCTIFIIDNLKSDQQRSAAAEEAGIVRTWQAISTSEGILFENWIATNWT